jgi:carbon-monoxide dehydrogenase small subunit
VVSDVEMTAIPESTQVAVDVRVNGEARRALVEPRLTLADFLREHCRLTGTHLGCEHGVCGACTVLLDGEAVRACLMFAVQANGREVTTIEGLVPEDGLSDVQEAFRACHGLQCGFCTPGFVVTVTAVLRDDPDPDDAAIREALSGNLCRCTGYQGIVAAVHDVVAHRRDGGAGGDMSA